ncbi:ribonuclease H-like domain-containing protein [bacterium]|nr:ribonuclease H-like domain-containing protein [bacterium]
MDLKEKLKFYESSVKTRSPVPEPGDTEELSRLVPGSVVGNNSGAFFRVTWTMQPGDFHGSQCLSQIPGIPGSVYARIGKDPALASFDPVKALYLDTETTGLAGGTGTVPFMVGLGFYSEASFIVEQYFMRDYHEERAMLEALLDRTAGFESIVTYNGKCYDINLLSSRFVMQRLRNPLISLPHLDLLFTARRLYKRRLSDCSLANIESCVLGFHRTDDIPGAMIPGLYFDYLRSGRPGQLVRIFEHNRWDILSLAALTRHAAQVYHNPSGILTHALDWYSLGRSLESVHALDEAVTCYIKLLGSGPDAETEAETRSRLALIHKKSDKWKMAVQAWEQMIQTDRFHIKPYEELAKYYEHRIRDYDRAASWVNRALERLEIQLQLQEEPGSFSDDRQALLYRLNRLKNKQARRDQREA